MGDSGPLGACRGGEVRAPECISLEGCEPQLGMRPCLVEDEGPISFGNTGDLCCCEGCGGTFSARLPPRRGIIEGGAERGPIAAGSHCPFALPPCPSELLDRGGGVLGLCEGDEGCE